MLFVWLVLWTVGMLLLWSNPASGAARRLSAVSFAGGAGGLSVVLGDSIEPYAAAKLASPALIQLLHAIEVTASLVSYYGMPYAFLLFAIEYNPSFPFQQWKRILAAVLLLPIAAMLLFPPLYPIPYRAVIWWVLPYIAAGTILLLHTKEVMPSIRRNHWLINLAVLPPVLFSTVMNYILPYFGLYEMWRYNTGAIVIAVAILLYSMINYGFMGVQLLIRRGRLDTTLRAVTSGTAILNHAIKNDVGKIKLFTEKMALYAEQTGQMELAEDVRVVSSSAQHIREMIMRVHELTQDISLQTGRHSLSELVRQTLQQLQPQLAGIEQIVTVPPDVSVECDKAQMAEVLHNIVLNALEAMPDGGELAIRLTETKKARVLEIRDTGCGIPRKQLKRVLEPFFTTKSGGRASRNFGLGLSYCYSVMKKLGGTLELQSEPGRGTGVYLHFPKKGRSGDGERGRRG